MDMIERVARAICRRYIESEMAEGGEWLTVTGRVDGGTDFFWSGWKEEARAAIESMREPTEEMRVAKDAICMSEAMDDIWSTMINAALKRD